MNILFSLMLLSVFICTPLKGQMIPPEEVPKDSLVVGILAGGTLSTIRGDLTEDHRFRGDLLLGVFAEYTISPYVVSKFQLYYQGMGTGYNDNFLRSSLRFGYLVLPVMIGARVSDEFNILIGPYGAYLVRAVDHTDNLETDIKNLISDLDFGFQVAVEYQLTTKIALLLGYHHGLHDISDNQSPRTFNQYNRAFNLSILYPLGSIGLKKSGRQRQP